MKAFLIVVLLVAQTPVYPQTRSFKLANVAHDQIENVLIAHFGLKGIDSVNTDIRIWTGSSLTQLEVNGSRVVKVQVVKFNFSVNNKEETKRCYFDVGSPSPEMARTLLGKLGEIDSIPSGESIQGWKVVLDEDSYTIQIVRNGIGITKSYYSLFYQEMEGIEKVKDLFDYIKKSVLLVSKLKLPPGQYMGLDRNLVYDVL